MCDASLIVVTRDRKDTLRRTLQKLASWYPADREILVYDDSASPGRLKDLADDLPYDLRWFSGTVPIGVSRGRNVLLKNARGRFVICLDDDVDILTPDACDILRRHFEAHPSCGIVTFRAWWSVEPPSPGLTRTSRDEAYECNDFLGGAHAMRADCFAAAGGFAEWMNLHGEEQYVAIGAALNGWEVHYLPAILVHHRAKPLEKRDNREQLRWWLRQMLRNQLGIVAARFPGRVIPLRSAQLMTHYFWNYGVRKGLARECVSAVLAFVRQLPRIVREGSRLSPEQYRRWRTLPPPVYYWSPDEE